MNHPQEIEFELALLKAELAQTKRVQRAAIEARIAQLEAELAGYRQIF